MRENVIDKVSVRGDSGSTPTFPRSLLSVENYFNVQCRQTWTRTTCVYAAQTGKNKRRQAKSLMRCQTLLRSFPLPAMFSLVNRIAWCSKVSLWLLNLLRTRKKSSVKRKKYVATEMKEKTPRNEVAWVRYKQANSETSRKMSIDFGKVIRLRLF